MNSLQILYPAFAMFFLTAGVFLALGISRYRAVKKREVNLKYYKLYKEGEEPDRLRVLSRHVANHFEVPPLFYIAVILIFITDQADLLKVILAWCFVFFRYVHTYIHLGGNVVRIRFFVFGIAGICLILLWLTFWVSLLRG